MSVTFKLCNICVVSEHPHALDFKLKFVLSWDIPLPQDCEICAVLGHSLTSRLKFVLSWDIPLPQDCEICAVLGHSLTSRL